MFVAVFYRLDDFIEQTFHGTVTKEIWGQCSLEFILGRMMPGKGRKKWSVRNRCEHDQRRNKRTRDSHSNSLQHLIIIINFKGQSKVKCDICSLGAHFALNNRLVIGVDNNKRKRDFYGPIR